MAIAPTSLAANFNGTDATSFSTGSVAVASHYNELITLLVVSIGAADPNIPTLTTARGLSIAQVATGLESTNHARATLFRTCIASGGTTGALVIDFGGQTQQQAVWDLVSWTGTAATAANNGSDGIGVAGTLHSASNSTTGSITLAALQSGSASFGGFWHGVAEAVVAGSGYTNLSASIIGSSPVSGYRSFYKLAGSTTVDSSWASNAGSAPRMGAAAEILLASTADTRFLGSIPI